MSEREVALWPWTLAVASLGVLYYCWRRFDRPKTSTDPEEMRRKRLEALERRQKDLASAVSTEMNADQAAENVTEATVGPTAENVTEETVVEEAENLTEAPVDAENVTPVAEGIQKLTSQSANVPAPVASHTPTEPGSYTSSTVEVTSQIPAPTDKVCSVASVYEMPNDDTDVYETGTSMASTAPAPQVVPITGPLSIAGDIRTQVELPQTATVYELRRILAQDGHFVRLFHQGRELRGEQRLFEHLKNTSLICRLVLGQYTVSHQGNSLQVKALPGDPVHVLTKAVRQRWGIPVASQSFRSHRGPIGETLSEELSLKAEFLNDDRQHVYRWVNSITVNGTYICAPNPLPRTEIQWTYREGHYPADDVVEEMSIAAAKVRCQQLQASGFSFALTENAEPSGRLFEEEESRQIHFSKRTDGVLQPNVLWATWQWEEVEAAPASITTMKEIPASDGYIVQINFAGKKGTLLNEIMVSPLHVAIQIFSTSVVDHQLRMKTEVAYERIVMDNSVTLAVSEKLNGSYAVLFTNTTVPFEGPIVSVALHAGEEKDKYKWATPAVFEFDVIES